MSNDYYYDPCDDTPSVPNVEKAIEVNSSTMINVVQSVFEQIAASINQSNISLNTLIKRLTTALTRKCSANDKTTDGVINALFTTLSNRVMENTATLNVIVDRLAKWTGTTVNEIDNSVKTELQNNVNNVGVINTGHEGHGLHAQVVRPSASPTLEFQEFPEEPIEREPREQREPLEPVDSCDRLQRIREDIEYVLRQQRPVDSIAGPLRSALFAIMQAMYGDEGSETLGLCFVPPRKEEVQTGSQGETEAKTEEAAEEELTEAFSLDSIVVMD